MPFQLRRTPIALTIGGLAVVAACAPAAAPTAHRVAAASVFSPDSVGPEAAAVASITPGDVHRRVSYLASDALRGRNTPSPGLDSAAAYLAAEHRNLGLQPGGEEGSYYQRYPLQTVALDTTTVHFGTVLGESSDNQMLAYGTDFFALPAASAGGPMGHGPLVYAGRVANGRLPAGDYQGAVVMVSLPGSYSRAWMAGLLRTRETARRAGAAALAVVVDPSFPTDLFGDLAAASRTSETTAVGALESDDIAVFVMTDAAFRRIAAREGRPVPTPERAPLRFEKPSAHFAAQLRLIRDARPPNVVAVLPGSDPALRDEYVVLSAHMDHIGVGAAVQGDSIYNGADDDASGTSALVEVAEALAMLPQPPRRSVVFLHVSGEEHGLLGSEWFSEHPTVPLDRIVANINVDMIGRNSPDSVVVIGKNYSSLGTIANAVQARHPELGLTLADDIWPEERFFFRSDHFNFARKEIPSLFFFSGVHEDYHQPSDEVESLDVDKTARISRMIFYIVREIADAPSRPTWQPAGLAEVRALTGN